MADIPITEIGVGGAVAVIIIREVFSFLKQKKNGELISRDEFDRHRRSVQYKDNCEQIVKRLDEANKAQETRFNNVDKQFDEVKVLIKNGGK